MTDREMLELAARAAGIPLRLLSQGLCNTDEVWDPLRDPGDALRLAVALHIELTYFAPGVSQYWTVVASTIGGVVYTTEKGPDELAATCRAITRAAAEIGKEMKP